jgi:hypothetical protein
MEENKEVDPKNIQFEYADKVAPNINREQSMINNINQWLGPSAESINGQAGTVVVYFQNNREQKVSFNGMAQDLQASLYKQLRKFQPSDSPQPDSPAI